MANIWEKNISILAGDLNSALSYLITTVTNLKIKSWTKSSARFGMIDPPFVHQTTCQVDPMLNFSRDVIHQKKPPGPYESNYSTAEDVNKLIHPPNF